MSMGNIKYTLWFILIIIKLTAQLPGQTVPIKYGLELALAADQIEGVSDGQGVFHRNQQSIQVEWLAQRPVLILMVIWILMSQ